MSLKSFFRSFKNVFWSGSINEDLQRKSSSAEDHDIFFLARDVVDYEEELKDLKSWIKDKFESPRIKLNDPDNMEPYIELNLDVETEEGDFRLVYYENYELVLRGDRKVTEDLEPEIGRELDVEFEQV
ncbi:MAG: hypothetical protein V5A87_05380 [Candidatus Bipolaricaulota bacterium]|nr:hypothetical protein [Candidatus Bipolaricaulota bacterium]